MINQIILGPLTLTPLAQFAFDNIEALKAKTEIKQITSKSNKPFIVIKIEMENNTKVTDPLKKDLKRIFSAESVNFVYSEKIS